MINTHAGFIHSAPYSNKIPHDSRKKANRSVHLAANKLQVNKIGSRNLSAENRAATEPMISVMQPHIMSMFDQNISRDNTEQSVNKAELYTLAREGLEMQVERQRREYRERKLQN